MEKQSFKEFPYVQQHLANERTFLAWVRTGIAIIGIGFLAAGVVLRSSMFVTLGHAVSVFTGVGAVILGMIIVALATKDYFQKRTAINKGEFHSPSFIVLMTFAVLGVVDVLLIILLFVLLTGL